MIISATLSNPAKDVLQNLGKEYIKIRMKKTDEKNLEVELFTEKQSFHKKMTQEEAQDFIEKNAGPSFKNAVVTTDTKEITYLTNRHGETKKITKVNSLLKPQNNLQTSQNGQKLFNRKKNYIIPEGTPVSFLYELGVMTKEGKVIQSKYDKFKQINRFLEFVDDIIPEVTELCVGKGNTFTADRPLSIADFGCGKSYLTFAVYHYLKNIKNIPVHITGLDLKEDVIENCTSLAKKLNWDNLVFKTGNVSDAQTLYNKSPDIMITLHACDTATDYALEYAVKNNAKAILSVPCCQHEINMQLEKNKSREESPFATLEKWGLIRERFAALATDAIRGELLESQGYSVQMLEFIDMSHTPKNILIRAVAKKNKMQKKESKSLNSILQELNTSQTLLSLLGND